MPPQAAAEPAAAAPATGDYQRHRPEETLLYQIVERHYPAFVEHLAEVDKQLPAHVRQAFDGYLQCGRLEHGFLRLRCDTCHAEHLLAFSCKRRSFCPSCGARRMARACPGLDPGARPGWSTRCCPSGRSGNGC